MKLATNANRLVIRHSSFVIVHALAHQSLTEYLRAAVSPSPPSEAGVRARRDSLHPAIILTLHTFGEYLDFHPHVHALVADGLFTRDLSACGHAQADGVFHPLPELPLKPLEELFRAHVLKLLVALKLLPPERVQVLLSWKHSGFNVHAGEPVPPENKAELEKLAPWNSLRSCRSSCSVYSTGRAQYILRNPFSLEKMTMESPTDTIIYRSKLNPKINRNFEVFTPTDFLAAITQHRSSAKCEVRVSKQDRQIESARAWAAFRIRHSSFVIRHLARPAAARETAVQEMARPHPASLAHRPAALPPLPAPHARHCRD